MALQEKLRLVSQKEIAPDIFEMVLRGEMVADIKAGQFLHIRVPDPSKLLRRPISVSRVDKVAKAVTIIYRVAGDGTRLLSQMTAGESLDVMGPQGNGFDLSLVSKGQKALVIGGGIGVPPMVEVAKELHENGVAVTAVLGFASKNAVILEKQMAQYGQVIVTTDDGSYGIKGYVSTVIDQFEETYDAVYACGAPGMLAYVDQTFQDHPQAFISLEERMACGMGACYACVVHLKDGTDASNERVCHEGPVFPTGHVVL
ncbi:dihydroorotate dehydrogenase electron transfer subunit [Streptococcus sp. DD12]|uniref:dihydroorotate dehydrogenase electron transfer subunit n=1 Tax=Streptococcus sp. DD12 TaxID=1777880 RepID=UPI000792DE01|nr:dihydroorotate dehydrogenase electron transfer subunit [Streptococcus sp. DD12]KXT76436.1 Dihydroorotate dehydrogenase electron transfer subunit [Streptococcus sp. DD12]